MERTLTVSEPRIIGAAIVVPKRTEAEPERMVSTEEIERVGMNMAMDFEKRVGKVPQNVSKQNLGFDIRSTMHNIDGTFKAIRYIEVKARSRSGSVHISANEWKKAKRFGADYWLYIIIEANTNSPKLTRIRHPAVKFRIDEDIYATGYIIPQESWVGVGNLQNYEN